MSGYVGIPTSYTPVEYIESTGTQYIDTGVNGTWSSTLQFISKFAFTQEVSSAEQTFIGNKDTSNQGTTVYVSTNTTNLGSWCGSGTGYQIGTFTVNADNNLDITFTKPQGRNGTYNGSSFNSTATANNYTSNTVNIAIFSSKAFQMETPAYMKLYFLKIKKDGVLVRDFIPAVDQDNVACLYDLVGNNIYYNKGSGTFSAGSTTGSPVSIGNRARKIRKAFVGIQRSYTPIEYIESTGTQYIDTNLKTNEVSKIEASASNTFGLDYEGISYGNSLFGARVSSTNSNFQYANGAYNEFVGNGTAQLSLTRNTSTNKLTIEISKTNYSVTSQNYNINGTLNVTISTALNIYLFGLNNNNVLVGGTWKIYTFKMYDNSNNLVRDFIPVLDDNNVACLYEQVENKLYYNKGAGTFLAGSTTGQPVQLTSVAGKIKRGYVGVNGVARLCLNIFDIPKYKLTFTTSTDHSGFPMLASTDDYILIAGGVTSSNTTPKNTVQYVNINGVLSSATNLPSGASNGGGMSISGYAMIMSGYSNSGWSSQTKQVVLYNNSMVRSSASDVTTGVFNVSCTSNGNKGIFACGSMYTNYVSTVDVYNSSLVKTNVSASSGNRYGDASYVNGYFVLCGGLSSNVSTDFYNSSNVKTTATNPYGKVCQFPRGAHTDNHAFFFGGATSDNANNAFKTSAAYNKNLVRTNFDLPVVAYKCHTFNCPDREHVWVGYGANTNSWLYNDNLVVEAIIAQPVYIGNDNTNLSTSNDKFAVIRQSWSTNAALLTF